MNITKMKQKLGAPCPFLGDIDGLFSDKFIVPRAVFLWSHMIKGNLYFCEKSFFCLEIKDKKICFSQSQ